MAGPSSDESRMVHVFNSRTNNNWVGVALGLCAMVLLSREKVFCVMGELNLGVASLNEGTLIKASQLNATHWELTDPSTPWEQIDLKNCWNVSDGDKVYKTPALYYSSNFGYVVAEEKTYQQRNYPQGKYWESPIMLERECLCKRRIAWIKPDLQRSLLYKNQTYRRPIGQHFRFAWQWAPQPSKRRNKHVQTMTNLMLTTFTAYKAMVIRLLQFYATVDVTTQVTKAIQYRGTEGGVEVMDFDKGILQTFLTNYVDKQGLSPYMNRIRYQFTGHDLIFEPLEGDFLIQEVDDEHNSVSIRNTTKYVGVLNETFWPVSTNIWPSDFDFPEWNEKIRWIAPTHIVNWTHDGEVIQKHGPMVLYDTYPSMLHWDSECKRRIERNKQCQYPVGSMEVKMRFWDETKYDPARNRTQFPAPPLMLKGGKWPSRNAQDPLSVPGIGIPARRNKRFIFEAIALIFAGINYANTRTLIGEINDRIDEMTRQVNTRFAQRFAQKLCIH